MALDVAYRASSEFEVAARQARAETKRSRDHLIADCRNNKEI
jgi:hypothetical protein